MKKRKYTKKSKYWSQFNPPKADGDPGPAQDFVPPQFAGENYYVEEALGSFRSELSPVETSRLQKATPGDGTAYTIETKKKN